MPSLPIPMISALALGFLFAALVLKRDRHWLLAVLVGACALQGVVISLGQHYGVSIFMAVQPVTAMLIPPLAWIAFQVTAVRPLRGAHEVLHLGGPLLTLLCAWRLPSALDVMIPLVFLGYGAAMMLALRSGVDGMLRIRLETGDVPALVWRFIALTLIASAFIDGAIAAAFLARSATLAAVDRQRWFGLLAADSGCACPLARLGKRRPGENRGEQAGDARPECGPGGGRRDGGPPGTTADGTEALPRSGPDARPPVAENGRSGQAAVGGDQPVNRRERVALRERVPG